MVGASKRQALGALEKSMSLSRKRMVIAVLCCIAFIVVVNVGLRFYSQFKPVRIVTASEQPLSKELLRALPAEFATNSAITERVLKDYDLAREKTITRADVRQIRSTLAWSTWGAYWPKRLEINNSSNVIVFISETEHRSRYIELRKETNRWYIAGSHVEVGEGAGPGLLEIAKQYLELIFLWRR